MIRKVLALVAVFLLGSLAIAGETQKIVNSRGQVTGSMRQSGNTLYFRDAQGRYRGKAIAVQPGRVIVLDARGRRK